MRHLRFEMRAMAGYGALVLLLAGGMALSLRGFAAMSDAQVARLRGEERAISLVERLRWNSELIESDGRGYLLSADARLVEDVEAASRRFDEHVRALHASDLSPEGTVLIGEVEEAAAGFRRVQEELFAARRAALDRALARLVEHKEAKLRT
ncbi:MAG: histidine kinase, partial [Kofleriaceae bacterium]